MSESPLNKDASGEEKTTADRLTAFSDAVFAVIVRIMALELKAPDQPAFSALWPLWPTALSYAVSYLFIAIIWINDHHLMGFAGPPTLGLIWINFVHLFMVSLLRFATAWVARTYWILAATGILGDWYNNSALLSPLAIQS